MKKSLVLSLRVLFFLTLFWVLLALVIGIHVSAISDCDARIIDAIIGGIPLALLALYLLYAYVIHGLIALKGRGCLNKGIIKELKEDKIFRTIFINSLTCAYAFLNAMINYITSFYHHTWFFISVATIYALVFFMKLFLLSFKDNGKRYEDNVIGILILLLSIASVGVLVLFTRDLSGFESKNLIIYWNCLYTFYAVISAIQGIIKTIKKNDKVRRRFLSVKNANAIYSMFNLTVIMVLTFDEGESSDMYTLSVVVGIVAVALIMALGIMQFLFPIMDKKKEENTNNSIEN